MLKVSSLRFAKLKSFTGQFVQVQSVNETVAELILTRPEGLNAITLSMARELNFACKQLSEEKEVRAVVIRGQGRGFCSGRDLKESLHHSDEEAREYLKEALAAVLSVFSLPMPTIAALHGCSLGLGLEIALACDIRVASGDCKFGFPETKLGMFPGAGGSFLLPLVLGSPSKSLELILTGDQFLAEKALNIGLVSTVSVDAAIEALTFANKIASNGPLGVRAAKRVIQKGIRDDFESSGSMKMAIEERLALTKTSDYREALEAFSEKRIPLFTGK